MNQTGEDIAILNVDNEVTSSWVHGLKARVVLFSTKRELQEGFFLRDGAIFFRDGVRERLITTRDRILLKGLHNVENILAAVAATTFCGVDIEVMREVLSQFAGVEHRLEFVTSINGVRFYNDSKATSVDATLKAIEALSDEKGKIILILGGRGKNAPYKPLIPSIERFVRALVLIGEEADRIESELKGNAQIFKATSMRDAVEKAFQAAQHDDLVLLSPACSSFDMFESFEHRGKVFKEAVLTLKQELSSELFK
jgi:UDP-N-acetylmuramoylalanine--D-glutamate ligase